jgi:signal transduction histidine kinase
LPLRRNDVLIGMIGVANRPGGFDEHDIEFLEPFLAVCAHMIDVIRTDRERAAAQAAEREAWALAERQERLGYIGRLASGVAHDMNNLITMISLQCSLLESEELSDSARQGVERILEACDNAAAMTARLQRLRSGSRGAEGGSCVIVPALAGSMGFLRSVAGRGVDLRFHLDVDEHTVVELSEGDLLQVMLNLVSNAGDAQQGHGSIRVKLSSTVQSGRPAVEVLVSDDGPGVPAELARDVFTPFSSTKGEGRGLGLPTVHLLLERCGGTIELVEHDAGGATFRLVIPVAAAA